MEKQFDRVAEAKRQAAQLKRNRRRDAAYERKYGPAMDRAIWANILRKDA